MDFIFWCEFPNQVNWKKLRELLKELDLKIKIYIAVERLDQYNWWSKELKKSIPNILEVGAWPVLPKSHGYWFSGFTQKDDIDKLNQFTGLNIKIDLEPPLPKFKYSNKNIVKYFLHLATRKGKNNQYLAKTIQDLSKDSKLLINEFPLPKKYLKKGGIHFPKIKNVSKNFMAYTSVSKLSKPFLRLYLKFFLRRAYKKNKDIRCSLGLAGPGIFTNEPSFENIQEFKKDLKMVKKIGIKNCALYSLETFMKRKNPKNWFSLVKAFE